MNLEMRLFWEMAQEGNSPELPSRGVGSPVGGGVVGAASISGQMHLSKER